MTPSMTIGRSHLIREVREGTSGKTNGNLLDIWNNEKHLKLRE